ncbi:34078_t:CDS:2, partial [Racocetra persica]
MTDSNISKNDLSDICRSLGISTEGNKADLVQRLKKYQTNEPRKKNVDGMKFTNDEADDESRITSEEQAPITRCVIIGFLQDAAETANNPQQTNKTKKQKLQAEEEDNSDPLIERVLLGFQKLENTILNFDNKLTSMAHQVQET